MRASPDVCSPDSKHQGAPRTSQPSSKLPDAQRSRRAHTRIALALLVCALVPATLVWCRTRCAPCAAPPHRWNQQRASAAGHFTSSSSSPGASASSRGDSSRGGSSWRTAAAHGRSSTAASAREAPHQQQQQQQQQQPGMANEQPPCLERPLVVLFGDSLTQYSFDPDGGWGAALAHHFQRKADVLNRGFGGYNSKWGRALWDRELAQLAGRRVLLLTLWWGANDAAIPGRSAERQHVPVAEFAANLAAMVGAARQAGNIANILLMAPPPVGDEGRVKHQQMRMGITTPVPPDRTLEYAQQYAQAVRDLGQTLQLPVVDLYSKLQQVPGWRQELLQDGLHFTPAGSRAVWEAVREVILEQMPQLSLEALPNQYPWWDRVDADNFEAYWEAAVRDMAAQQQQTTHEAPA